MVFDSKFVDARCFLLIVSSGACGFLSGTSGGSCLSILFWVDELDSLSGVVLTSMKSFSWRAKDLLTGLFFRL